MAADFAIVCQHCSEVLWATDEHVSMAVQCPACQSVLIVPTRFRAAKLEKVTQPLLRTHRQSELEAVRQVDPSLTAYIEKATNKDCWEFGLTAKLLYLKIMPLQRVVAKAPSAPSVYRRPRRGGGQPPDFVVLFTQECDRFFGIVNGLQDLFADDLSDTLEHDDVLTMLEFGHRFGDLVQQLAGWAEHVYELPAPPDVPYPQLISMMQGWPGHCAQSLNKTLARLDAIYQSSGADLGYIEFQISLVPNNLRQFFLYKNLLPRRKVFSIPGGMRPEDDDE